MKFNYLNILFLGFSFCFIPNFYVLCSSFPNILQLDPRKLVGYYFGIDELVPWESTIKTADESLFLCMKKFAENYDEIQLVYVGSDTNVANFNLLKLTHFSENQFSSKGLFAVAKHTQIAEALIRKFNVSTTPTLLICDANDRVIDAKGLNTLKIRVEPFSYWKSINTSNNLRILGKKDQKKKSEVETKIEQLDKQRTHIISKINEHLLEFISSLKQRSTKDKYALDNLSNSVITLIDHAKELSKYADAEISLLAVKEKHIEALSALSPSVKHQILKDVEYQKSKLLKLRDNLLLLILEKRKPFNRLCEQSNELISNIQILGRDQTVSLIVKNVMEFQEIYIHSYTK